MGDIPYATWETNGTSYATDYFYMDLNGNWYDTDDPPNGVYDVHNGTIEPEIWVGRLKASNVEGDEICLFERYFKKNHEYRNASARVDLELPLSARPRALAYVDNEPAVNVTQRNNPDPVRSYDKRFVNDTVTCLKKAYSNVTLVVSPILNAMNTNPTNLSDKEMARQMGN